MKISKIFASFCAVAVGVFTVGGGLQGLAASANPVPFSVTAVSNPFSPAVTAGQKQVKVAAFDLKAEENITVNSLSFGFKGDTPKIVQNIALTLDGKPVSTIQSQLGSNNKVNFINVNYAVAKGKTAKIALYADVSAAAKSAGFQFILRQVKASDDNTTKLFQPTYALFGSIVYVISLGTLEITTDESTPKGGEILAGSMGNLVSIFKAKSTNESFMITKLTFKNYYTVQPGDADNNIAAVTLYYTDAEGVPSTKMGIPNKGEITFSGLNIGVQKDSGTKMEVKIDVTPFPVATAGQKVSIDLVNFEAIGTASAMVVQGGKTGEAGVGLFTVK